MISNMYKLILLSAKSVDELRSNIDSLIEMSKNFPLDVVTNKLQVRFQAGLPFKLALLPANKNDLLELVAQVKLKIDSSEKTLFVVPGKIYYSNNIEKPRVAFLFSGQGSQYINMSKDLLDWFPASKEIWEIADSLSLDSKNPLSSIVFPDKAKSEEEEISQNKLLMSTEWAQPAIGAVALVQLNLLETLNLKASYLGGHSYGEIVALYAAGVIDSSEQLLEISRKRGEFIVEASTTSGAMLALSLTESEIKNYVQESGLPIYIANINSPDQIVVSGEVQAIADFEEFLVSKSVFLRRLNVSTAFHSDLIATSTDKLYTYFNTENFNIPTCPVYCNTTAEPYPEDIKQIKKIVSEQLVKPVRFVDQISNMHRDGAELFIEIGPGSVLTKLVSRCLKDKKHYTISLDQKEKNSVDSFLNAVAMISILGIELNFQALSNINNTGLAMEEPTMSDSTVLKPHETTKSNMLRDMHDSITKVQREFQKTLTDAYTLFLKSTESILNKINIGNIEQVVKLDNNNLIYRDNVDFSTIVLDIISEKTGYPKDMLSLEMSLESELGIDSLKRTEIVAALNDCLEQDFNVNLDLAKFKTIVTIQDLVHAIGDIAVTTSTQENNSAALELNLTKDDLSLIILETISEKTGYPQDMISLEMNLEAELGIDSLKRTEILAGVAEKLEANGISLNLSNFKKVLSAQDAVNTIFVSLQQNETSLIDNNLDKTQSIASSIERHVVKYENQNKLGISMPLILYSDNPIYIIRDNRGIAELLHEELNQHNLNSILVDDVPQNAASVICLLGLNSYNSMEELVNLNGIIFEKVHKISKSIEENRGTLILAYNNDMLINMRIEKELPSPLGVDTLAKVAANEGNDTHIKSIGLPFLNSSEIVDLIYSEILSGGPEISVLYNNQKERLVARSKEVTVSADLSNTNVLKNGDTIIVTGGAQGITATCLLALSKQYSLNIIIFGRTDISQIESDITSNIKEKSLLMKTITQDYADQGKKQSLSAVENEVNLILKKRQINETISGLEKTCCKVAYYTVDICDGKEVNKIITKVRRQFKKIDALIHGAGVLSDKYIRDQTLDGFNFVFNIKVYGFLNLINALSKDKLKLICNFSSIAAQIGSIGQSNYSMANQVLNKLSLLEQERRGQSCIIKSINWGPWDGGMVDASLKAYFKKYNIGLITPVEGANAFIEEITQADNNVEIVIAHNINNFAWIKDKYIWTLLLNREACPLLQDHIIDTAVVPNALIMDWCINLSRYLFPGCKRFVLNELKMIKGIQVKDYDNKGEIIKVQCIPHITANDKRLDFTVLSKDEMPYYKLSIIVDSVFDINSIVNDGLHEKHDELWRFSAEDSYNQKKLFVGPTLQVISKLESVSTKGCTAYLGRSKSSTFAHDNSFIDVALLDGGIQLSLLWRNQYTDTFALPTAVDELYIEKNENISFPLKCYLSTVTYNDLSHKVNIVFEDNDKKIIAYMKGLSMHVIAQRESQTSTV